MIKHITHIFVEDHTAIDQDGFGLASDVPFLEGSGVYSQNITEEEKGPIEKIEISMTIPQYLTVLTHDLTVHVYLEGKCFDRVGTRDIPARFEIKKTNTSSCKATLKYERIPRR